MFGGILVRLWAGLTQLWKWILGRQQKHITVEHGGVAVNVDLDDVDADFLADQFDLERPPAVLIGRDDDTGQESLVRIEKLVAGTTYRFRERDVRMARPPRGICIRRIGKEY